MTWAWNRPITEPGWYWVYHDHRMDEEPYVIRVFRDLDGDLSYFATNGEEAKKVNACRDFNYWLPLKAPER